MLDRRQGLPAKIRHEEGDYSLRPDPFIQATKDPNRNRSTGRWPPSGPSQATRRKAWPLRTRGGEGAAQAGLQGRLSGLGAKAPKCKTGAWSLLRPVIPGKRIRGQGNESASTETVHGAAPAFPWGARRPSDPKRRLGSVPRGSVSP